MKRIIALLLTAVLTLSIFTVISSAAPSATPSISGTSSATAGSSASYTVTVQANMLIGCEGTIEYDASALEYVGFEKGSSAANLSVSVNALSAGKLRFAVSSTSLGTDMKLINISGKNQLVKLNFKIKSSAAADTKINVKATELVVAVYDEAYNRIKITPSSVSCVTTVAKVKDSNSTLSSLKVTNASGGANIALSPNFASSVKSYSASVDFAVSKVNITATPTKSTSKYSVSPNPSSTTLKAGGTTEFTVTCTAENGSTTKYVIKIKRATDPNAKSSDATLKSITVKGYSLSPAFSKTTYKYTVTVPYETTSVQLTATKNHAKATVSPESVTKELNVGNNDVVFTCTAQDGSKKTYTVTVVRKDKAPETTTPVETAPPEVTTVPDGTETVPPTEEPGRELTSGKFTVSIGMQSAPENAQLSADIITSGDMYEDVKSTLGSDNFEMIDIALISDGFEIVPKDGIQVTLPIPEGIDESSVYVYEAVGMNKLDCTVADGNVTFTASKTGEFAISATEIAADIITVPDEQTKPEDDKGDETDEISTGTDTGIKISGAMIAVFAVVGVLLLATGAGIMFLVMKFMKKRSEDVY